MRARIVKIRSPEEIRKEIVIDNQSARLKAIELINEGVADRMRIGFNSATFDLKLFQSQIIIDNLLPDLKQHYTVNVVSDQRAGDYLLLEWKKD